MKIRWVDIKLLIRKTIFYFSLTFLMAVIYTVLVAVGELLFSGLPAYHPIYATLLAAAIIALSWDFLREGSRGVVDTLFFKPAYDYQATLREASATLTGLADLSGLLNSLTKILYRQLALSGAAALFLEEKKGRYKVIAGEGDMRELNGITLSANYPLILHLEKRRQILRGEEEELKALEAVKKDLDKLKATLCVPIFSEGKLTCFLSLGKKSSGEMYGWEDLQLLSLVSNQAAVAVENSLLFEREKEAVRKSLELESKVKIERLASITQITVTLNHEINNPLTAVLSTLEILLAKMKEKELPADFLSERLQTAEKEALRIRDILRDLQKIAEPIVKEYLPGTTMISLEKSKKEEGG